MIFKKGEAKIRKYILPAAIIILSFFFLHTFIDDGKKEPVETKSYDVPQILSRENKVNAVFLSKGDRKITNKMVAEAAKKAATVVLDPDEEASVQLGANQSGMQISEWDLKKGKITGKLEPYFIPGAINRLDTRIVLIRSEMDGRPVTYLTKIQVRKLYSYQELLNPDLDGNTLLVFSSAGEEIGGLALKSQKYVSREVKGTLPELQQKYHDLEIRTLPSIFIFRGMMRVFKSEDMGELRSLITEKKTFIYEGANENWQVSVKVKQDIYRKNVETFITYTGKDTITGDIFITLNGEQWGWQLFGGKLQSRTLNVSGETPLFISNEEKLKATLSWNGKEERINLVKKGETSLREVTEPSVTIEAKVSKLTDEQYGDVGTNGLENPRKEDFRYFTFDLKTDDLNNTIQKIDFRFREAIDTIDGIDRYWYGSGYGKPEGGEHGEYVFYSKGLTEEQIKKAIGSMVVTVLYNDGENKVKEYKLLDYLEIEE